MSELEGTTTELLPHSVFYDIAKEAASPVLDWQSEQSFDPIKYLLERLEIQKKRPSTVHAYKVTAARFVARAERVITRTTISWNM